MLNNCKNGRNNKGIDGRTQCRELPLCAGSGEGCQWQALPSPVQCEETTTRTWDLPVTGGKTLPLAPGPPFLFKNDSFFLMALIYYHHLFPCCFYHFYNYSTIITLWVHFGSFIPIFCLLDQHKFSDWCFHVCLCRGNMVDAFRMHIMQTKELGTCPVRQIGGCSFLYMRISNVYIVIVVSSNANVACAFKFVVEVCYSFCAMHTFETEFA